MMLDTRHSIETPEGVDLELRAAGPPVRFLAWLIDLGLRFAAWGLLAIPFAVLGEFGTGVMLLTAFALEWLYPVLFEMLFDGATPGKRSLGLQVVQRDGSPIDLSASVLRNLLRAADLLPMFYVFGLVSMCFTRSFQRLGDLAAGTVVVYREAGRRPRVVAPAVPLPPPVPLRLEEQRVILGFAQRAAVLPQDRVQELARVAAPLLEASPSAVRNPVEFLQSIAAWLVGRRPAGDRAGGTSN